MTSIARHIMGTLRLQDDLIKQAADEVKLLRDELTLAHAYIAMLEAKVAKAQTHSLRVVEAGTPALLRPQAE